MPLLTSQATPVRVIKPAISRGREWSRAWAMAAVLMVMTLAVAVPVGYVVMTWGKSVANAPGKLTGTLSQAAAEAMRPKVMINQIVLDSVANLHKESKLVVFTADVNADITREEGSASWGMYWGTNVSRVTVHDARVQYVIDLSGLQTSDMIYNDDAKVLTVYLPRPKIDSSMVAIDPGQIQTLDLRGGWARFDKQETRDHAIAELKPQVLSQASAPFVRELAQSAGIDAGMKLISPLASALSRDGAQVRVAYRD